MNTQPLPPFTFHAGDSASWSLDLPDFPAVNGWVLHYRLLWVSAPPVTFTAQGDGTVFTATLTSAGTSDWTAGSATLVWFVAQPDARQMLGTQGVTILPDLTVAQNLDTRSQNVRALADARSALAQYIAMGQGHVTEYDIVGRRMKFRSVDELTDLIAFYERECAKDRAQQALLQGGSLGRVLTRF